MVLLTIILPTYNERYVIRDAITTIDDIVRKHNIDCEILVVDDNSPDNTKSIVESMQRDKLFSELNILVREEDHGLSKSINDGFKIAKGEYIFVTDADLQHDIEMIPKVLNLFETNDILIGSRYCKDGKINDWSGKRKLISFGATKLAKCLFPKLSDPVSGFFGVKRSVVSGIDFDKSRGYKILMDVLEYGKYNTVCEFPYTFKSRMHGDSKLGKMTILDFVFQLLELIKHALMNRGKSHIWKTWGKFVKFGIVGLSGVVVNYGGYCLLSRVGGLDLLYASLLAIEMSIISNFIFNNGWTFKNKSERSLLFRFSSFQGISLFGLVIQMVSLLILVDCVGLYDLVAYPMAIIVAFLFNYILNTKITWKE